MMGPMGTLLGVLAGELWLVAGEDTGDDSLLSEDPAEREHRNSGAVHVTATQHTHASAVRECSRGVRPKSSQAGKGPAAIVWPVLLTSLVILPLRWTALFTFKNLRCHSLFKNRVNVSQCIRHIA